MTYRFVYLAGPITGCNSFEANNWRERVDKEMKRKEPSIKGISPLRCEPIIGERYCLQHADERFGTARAIAAKNMADVRMCDMMLAYLPKPLPGSYPSVGTIGEIHWGRAYDKPVIVVTDDPYMQQHPTVNACAGWMLPTLDDAVDVLVGVLGGYAGGKGNV